MKPIYSNITAATGAHQGGVCSLKIIPKEYIAEPFTFDFESGKVVGDVVLLPGKDFFNLAFTAESFEFDEKPKSGKNGPYFETTITGMLNDITPEILQVLHSFRQHELVAIVKDMQRRTKLVGNKDKALRLLFSNKENTQQVVGIELTMENECASPFYEP